MVSTIKTKVMLAFGGLLLVSGALIKFLLWRNKVKDEKIDTLEQNIEVAKKVQETDIKRVTFEAKQQQKVKAVNDESDLDKLDHKREVNDKQNKDDPWDSVTR